jgi:hypothetical protein
VLLVSPETLFFAESGCGGTAYLLAFALGLRRPSVLVSSQNKPLQYLVGERGPTQEITVLSVTSENGCDEDFSPEPGLPVIPTTEVTLSELGLNTFYPAPLYVGLTPE